MKTNVLALGLVLWGCCGPAAEDVIRAEAKVIEASPSTKLTQADCESDAALKKKSAHVLTAPVVAAKSGEPVVMFVGQQRRTPRPTRDDSAAAEPGEGIVLKLTSEVAADMIRFRGSLSLRKLEHESTLPAREASEYSVRELNFAGSCRQGEPVFVEMRGVKDKRKVYLHLALRL